LKGRAVRHGGSSEHQPQWIRALMVPALSPTVRYRTKKVSIEFDDVTQVNDVENLAILVGDLEANMI
jgi:hypothetical protein